MKSRPYRFRFRAAKNTTDTICQWVYVNNNNTHTSPSPSSSPSNLQHLLSFPWSPSRSHRTKHPDSHMCIHHWPLTAAQDSVISSKKKQKSRVLAVFVYMQPCVCMCVCTCFSHLLFKNYLQRELRHIFDR